ncbi:hypothetical protein [Chryseobacterium nematophagum]|uniref:hypothetical protein n=1 Tax=Chryseobacterium nematophagum TaxID=2305228 RepID=UPI001604F2E7|nr:hypothetical protein [Chryseobacterium nematophagum]
MKRKKQTEKKLSLKKLQMIRISNPKIIKGGGYSTNNNIIGDNGNYTETGTFPTDK